MWVGLVLSFVIFLYFKLFYIFRNSNYIFLYMGGGRSIISHVKGLNIGLFFGLVATHYYCSWSQRAFPSPNSFLLISLPNLSHKAFQSLILVSVYT